MTRRADALSGQSATHNAQLPLNDPREIDPPRSERFRRNESGFVSRIAAEPAPVAKSATSAGDLYLALQPRVTRIARSLLGEAPSVELVHDVCVNAALSAVRFRGDSAFSSWLYAVVARHVRKWIRTERRRRSLMNEVAHYSSTLTSMQPDDLVSGNRLATRLLEALDVLSDRQKTCVIQVQFEGHSVHAVAARLGISPDAVRMNVHRARNHLRSCIETKTKSSE
jgi:RNA polymerase sigma-70 factor (ECF subfamily)